MKKRILLSLAVIAALTIGVVGMSAYEAHVINVTAHIENALTVVTTPIAFGTVFPQENLTDKTFDVSLSSSFLATGQTRLDDVDYKIEPKVKCIDAQQNHVQCVVGADAQNPTACACPAGTTPMNDLCKFLSVTTAEVGDLSRPSYFTGQLLGCVTPNPLIATGNLNKQTPDTSDTWTVDLKVPPVSGQAATDWPANCATWVVAQDAQDYGCDLWVEVTGFSKCGNGIVEGLEECDDANSVDDDGCRNDCTIYVD
jgi:cysteine-rich repeat protein